MAGMAHSSFPHVNLLFSFFAHAYWYAARRQNMPYTQKIASR
jgi:hypothetical protein